MNVREKVVIGSRSKKYHVCQVVAMTNLTIAGCLTRAFLSVKQQVFFGLHMKKARECSVFYVRNTTLKTKRTNPKRIMQLQVCASKNPQLKNILHLNNTKMPLRQRWAFWCILFLAAHNNSRRYAEKNFNTVFYTGNLSRFPIESEMGNFPIHGENLEQEIPFLGGF